jgi:hypothetical protein
MRTGVRPISLTWYFSQPKMHGDTQIRMIGHPLAIIASGENWRGRHSKMIDLTLNLHVRMILNRGESDVQDV